MDIDIAPLKKELRFLISRNVNRNTDLSLYERCIDATNCLSILKITIPNANLRKQLITKYADFKTAISYMLSTNIEQKLNDLIDIAMQIITNPIGILINNLNGYIRTSKAYGWTKLSQILGYSIGCCLLEYFVDGNDFETFWVQTLQEILRQFGLVTRDNLFAKYYSAKFLLDEGFGVRNDEIRVPIFDRSRLLNFTNHIFGDVKCFKFFKKACMIYEAFLGHEDYNNSENEYFETYITCSTIPENFANNNSIKVNQTFCISPVGMQGNNRLDRFLLVGKHRCCDIKLPEEDNEIDDIAFAIFHNRHRYYILDYSKKTYLSKKMQIDFKMKLRTNLVISIANCALMNIENEVPDDNDSGEISSTLYYKYLTGPLINAAGNPIRQINTRRNGGTNQTCFNLGNGIGVRADLQLRCSDESTRTQIISRNHLHFEFIQNEWFAKDPGSTNGNFVLYKNSLQYSNKKQSDIFRLFDDRENFISLSYNGYGFYIKGN